MIVQRAEAWPIWIVNTQYKFTGFPQEVLEFSHCRGDQEIVKLQLNAVWFWIISRQDICMVITEGMIFRNLVIVCAYQKM